MEWEQERYDLKRKLSEEQAARKFLEEDVEVVQKQLEDYKKKTETLMKKLKDKEDCFESSELEWKNKVEVLQTKLKTASKDQSGVLEEMKAKIDKLLAERDSSSSAADSEVQTLKMQNENLILQVEALEYKAERVLEENSELQKVVEELLNEKSNLEEILKSKRESLATLQEKNETLQNDLASLQREYDELKAKPTDAKGNSVFAEVDDNRKALKKNLDELAEKYKDVKKQYKHKCSEVSKLRAERSSLMKSVEEITTKYSSFESDMIDSYKIRIKDLVAQVQHLKISEDINHRRIDTNDFKALDSLFESKRKEIEILREKLDKNSETILIQSELLHSLRMEMQVLQAKYAYEQSERLRLEEECQIKTYGEYVED